jgi:hypothetical protein
VEIRKGDAIEVVSNKVDQPDRHGVVTQVLEEDPLRLEVEWDDGHTSIFLPAGGNTRVRSSAS